MPKTRTYLAILLFSQGQQGDLIWAGGGGDSPLSLIRMGADKRAIFKTMCLSLSILAIDGKGERRTRARRHWRRLSDEEGSPASERTVSFSLHLSPLCLFLRLFFPRSLLLSPYFSPSPPSLSLASTLLPLTRWVRLMLLSFFMLLSFQFIIWGFIILLATF